MTNPKRDNMNGSIGSASFLLAVAVLFAVGCPVESQGGLGEPCYPNDVCDAGLVCGDAGVCVEDDGGTGEDIIGWVWPRCNNALVFSCADCPGLPYACDACGVGAFCVADCAGECSGLTNCGPAGMCINPAYGNCGEEPFCGCPPETKACREAGWTTCVDNCADECSGQPLNGWGVCSNEASVSCLDEPGPEYMCYGSGENVSYDCAPSCEACDANYCVSASCYANLRGGTSCEQGYVPGMSFYLCGPENCCSDGFFCPPINQCVDSCTECGPGYEGACGHNGVCVSSCSECGETSTQLCDGVCADLSTSRLHCGGCNQNCESEGTVFAECVEGKCCRWRPGIGEFLDTSTPWCEACNCCWKAGWPPCDASTCEEGCLPL